MELFYDANKGPFKEELRKSCNIIIYRFPQNETREIGSLEGIFVASSNKLISNHSMNPLCRRDQMADFEKEFRGKFVPFENKE